MRFVSSLILIANLSESLSSKNSYYSYFISPPFDYIFLFYSSILLSKSLFIEMCFSKIYFIFSLLFIMIYYLHQCFILSLIIIYYPYYFPIPCYVRSCRFSIWRLLLYWFTSQQCSHLFIILLLFIFIILNYNIYFLFC